MRSRIVRLTLVAAGLSLGAVVLAGLTLFFLSLLAFHIPVVGAMAWVALAGSLVLATACCLQAYAWFTGKQELTRASWWAHVVSYVAALVAVVGFAFVCARSVLGAPLFWMTLAGGVLALVAQSLGGVQHLRTDGPPGTLGTHVRGFIQRTNAREDAAVAEATDEETP